MDPVRRRSSERGFSLTEVAISLGLLAGMALPLMGLLAIGVEDTKVAWDVRTLGSIRSTLRQQLQDPAWPEEAARGGAWTAIRTFDLRGEMVAKTEGALGTVEAKMIAQPGIGYRNPWLECVRVTFQVADSSEVLGECVLQRMRQPTVASP